MAVLAQASASRVGRRVALVGAAVLLGTALAWLLQDTPPVDAAARPAIAAEPLRPPLAPAAPPLAPGCDARCVAAQVIGPATTACAAAVEDLSGFGVRWLDDGAARPKFDRFAWLQVARRTVTLTGDRAEFRNAAGAYLAVEYGCDFDPKTLTVLEARARPRSPTLPAQTGPAAR